MSTRIARIAAVSAALGLLLAGCSSGSKKGGAASSPAGSTAAGSTAAQSTAAGSTATGPTAAASTSAPGATVSLSGADSLDVSKLCAAVPAADIQALFKGPAPAVVVNPGECDWGHGAITVDIYRNDANKKFYSVYGPANLNPLSGVGDVAAWQQPYVGRTVPNVVAHKGQESIVFGVGINVSASSITYTGSDPIYTVTPSAAVVYATKEGKICNDMFAAG